MRAAQGLPTASPVRKGSVNDFLAAVGLTRESVAAGARVGMRGEVSTIESG